jgi:hypothetical protein
MPPGPVSTATAKRTSASAAGDDDRQVARLAEEVDCTIDRRGALLADGDYEIEHHVPESAPDPPWVSDS